MPKRATSGPLRQSRQLHRHFGQRRWSLRGSPVQRTAVPACVPWAWPAVWACAWLPPWFRSNRYALCQWCPLSHSLPRCPAQCVARSMWHLQVHVRDPAGLMGLLGRGPGGPEPPAPLGGMGVASLSMLLWLWPGTARELRPREFGGPRPVLGARTTASSPEPPPVARPLPIILGPSAAWSSHLKDQKGLDPGVGLVCPPENPSPFTPSYPHSADRMPLKHRLILGKVRGCD